MNGTAVDPLLELRDIYAAPQPSWWPPAMGWWLVAALALIVTLWLLQKLWRYYQCWRQRRWVLNYLATLYGHYRENQDGHAFAAEVAVLLRRVALSRFPPRQVAALSDQPWLSFLDLHGGKDQFSQGPGRALLHAPYAAHSELDAAGLYKLTRAWIKHNL